MAAPSAYSGVAATRLYAVGVFLTFDPLWLITLMLATSLHWPTGSSLSRSMALYFQTALAPVAFTVIQPKSGN